MAGEAVFSSQPGKDVDLREQRFPITPERAIEIAKDKVAANGVLHSIELDYRDDMHQWKYDVEILVGKVDHEVKIDAITGEVLAHEKESTNDAELSISLSTPMTFDEALQLALILREGKVGEWKLEDDDGRIKYQFDITVGSDTKEVKVDVLSRQVTLDG